VAPGRREGSRGHQKPVPNEGPFLFGKRNRRKKLGLQRKALQPLKRAKKSLKRAGTSFGLEEMNAIKLQSKRETTRDG